VIDEDIEIPSKEDDGKETEGQNGPKFYRHWKAEIDIARKWMEPYQQRVEQVYREYRSDPVKDGKGETKKANIWFATVESIKPSIFSSVPKVDIRRRKNATDKISRLSALIWERATDYSQECHQDSYYIYQRARDAYMLAGRPILWERYEPSFESTTEDCEVCDEEIEGKRHKTLDVEFDPKAVKTDEQGIKTVSLTYDKKTKEKSITDHVHAADFVHNEARTEDEIRFKGRRHFLTRKALHEKFGKAFEAEFDRDIRKAVKCTRKPSGIDDVIKGDETQKRYLTAVVWEIWDSVSKKIIYLAEGFKDGCIEIKDAPTYIEGFFPCATCITTSVSPDSVLPIPEYCMVRDQCMTINQLTERIDSLESHIRVNGAYPAELAELAQVLQQKDKLVPLKNLPLDKINANLIIWLPIQMFIEALQALYEAREREIQMFYQICRYSDLMRGISDPRTTATAEQAKVDYGNTSLQQKQRDFQQFLRDQLYIKAQIIAENFDPETLLLAAGDLNEPVTEEEVNAAIALLKDEYRLHYVIDIETDSTIAPDEAREKQLINEFMATLPDFMQRALEFAQNMPGMLLPMVELIKALTRRYKFGKSIEAAFDAGVTQLQQALQQQASQPPQQDPLAAAEMAKAQAEMAKAQNQGTKNGQDFQVATQRLQLEANQKYQEAMTKLEVDKAELTLRARELGIKEKELEIKMFELQLKAEELGLNREKATADLHIKGFEAAAKVQQQAQVAAAKPAETAKTEKAEKEKPKDRVAKIERGPDGKMAFVTMHDVDRIE
jgi:hypothetical protein